MTGTLPTQFKDSDLSPLTRPNALGRFGKYGGQYVPETLIPALIELEQVEAKKILKNLKIACGTGGAVKGDFLELQGDQISKAQNFLLKEGFRPKQSGG